MEEPLVAKGWHRIHDRTSTNFKLKWVELKSHIHYHSFKPGELFTTEFNLIIIIIMIIKNIFKVPYVKSLFKNKSAHWPIYMYAA